MTTIWALPINNRNRINSSNSSSSVSNNSKGGGVSSFKVGGDCRYRLVLCGHEGLLSYKRGLPREKEVDSDPSELSGDSQYGAG